MDESRTHAWDAVVVGAGPAGASFAAHAAAGGARVLILERSAVGRDKSCGDGLTPRAMRELDLLGLDDLGAHRVDGLRIVRKTRQREVLWPERAGFSSVGGTLRRAVLDERLLRCALAKGAELREHTEVEAVEFQEGGVSAVRLLSGETICTGFVAVATGAGSPLAALLGARRSREMLQGVAIRAYAPSTMSDDRYLEASIAVAARGALPGYGWVFPLGDGSVNIGYGTLMRAGNGGVNLRHELVRYHESVRERWGLGEFERDWAWRLPMHVDARHGEGWVALGDAAGLVNPCNGEGIDYALESGRIAAEELLRGGDPRAVASRYDERLATEMDWFLNAARRFAQSIRDPLVLDVMLGGAMLSDSTMRATAAVLGNILDPHGKGALERAVRGADWTLRKLDR